MRSDNQFGMPTSSVGFDYGKLRNALGSNASGFGALIPALFGGGRNPMDAGMPYMQQIGQLYSPYMQQGNMANNMAMGQYGRLVNNPGDLYKQLGAGYSASPGYQFQKQQATDAAANAAAAGGMAGTPYHQMELSKYITGLANQDYNNYMDRMLGMYGMGLGGYGNMGQMGFNAANQYGTNMQNMGQMAMEGQRYNNQRNQGLFGSLGNLFSGLFGGLF
jgi:hypothetical protein